MSKTITIDGVEYVPATQAKDYSDSPVRIVILQRGWVFVGRWSQEGEMCALDNARNVRKWGTTGVGLGALATGPRAETVLDPAGHVEFHILAVVATIACEESAWDL